MPPRRLFGLIMGSRPGPAAPGGERAVTRGRPRRRRPSIGRVGRTDRARRVVAAPATAVYDALVDRGAVESWLPPEGMRGRIDRWDPRPGGGFRMVLTYLDATDAPGKSTDATDVVEVGFVALEPPERVVQQAVFDSDDPAYAGTMTMTWELLARDGRTEVSVTATDVPPGIEQDVHEEAMASSLAQLAAHVEESG